ncbi:MAG: hypothetical protein FJ125_15425, partial [Deltaproteobacteria bacterium]|nr:hypothetical protein [Deltaproteobacteria bacterium]
MLDRHRLALLRSLLVLVAGGLALLTAGPLLAAGSEPVGPHFAEQEAARLSAAIAAEPTSAAAFARLIRLWDQRGQLADPAALQAHLERLAARRDLPPLLRGWVVFHLAAALERIGELAAARTLLAGLGFPPDWRVLGPFEDHGGAGFGEPFSPEAEARHGTPPDAVYTGAEGEIRWRTLPELGALGRIDLTPLFARSDEVLAYLAVAFHLERASDLALRVGSSDGLKMFVDGQPVHDRQLRRAAVFDQEAVPLRLAAGWHRLLFKVAHEEGS